MISRKHVLAACVLAVTTGTACELLVNHTLSLEGPSVEAEAGTDANADTDGAPPAFDCKTSMQPPSSPPPDDGKPGSTYLMAVRTVDLLRGQGFNQDRTCTCIAGGPASCLGASEASKAGCDGDGGVDDVVGSFGPLLPGELAKRLRQQVSNIARCGEQSLILALTDYNGTANDSNVKIFTTAAYGVRDPHDAGEDPTFDGSACQQDAGYYPPRWDGTDNWAVGAGTTGRDGTPITIPLVGYVRDWELVADGRLPSQAPGQSLSVNLFDTVPIRFGSPVLVTTLIPLDAKAQPIPLVGGVPTSTPSSFMMKGLVAGRASREDIVRASALTPTSTGGPLNCTQSQFAMFQPILCQYADIMLEPAQDSKDVACNALSITVALTAYPARDQIIYDGGVVPDASVCDASTLTCAN